MWSWQRAQLSVMPRNALAVCSTVSSSHTLRLKRYQLRTRKPVARSASGSLGREFVGGQHLDDHLVVGLVGVERFDDPIAPPPDVRLALAHLRRVAVPIAVAPDVHPVPAPALAVVRTGQQAIDHVFVGVGRRVGQELAQLGRASAAGRSGRDTRAATARSWPPAARASARAARARRPESDRSDARPRPGFARSGSGGVAAFETTNACADRRAAVRRARLRRRRSRP